MPIRNLHEKPFDEGTQDKLQLYREYLREWLNPSQMQLFPEFDKPSKIALFEKELTSAVLGRQLTTNKDVYLFSLRNGMLATHAKNGLRLLMKNKKLPEQVLHISYDAWKKPEVEIIRHF